jgi:CubicO group peptidase (beta-lactamase class C family)
MTLLYDWEGQTYNLDAAMEAMHVPGFSFVLFRGDGSQDMILRGHRGDTARSAMRQTTPFPVGAMSGAPVCFAILQLVDRGVIELDAPVRQYLTSRELTDRRLLKWSPVTVRDILLYRRNMISRYKPQGYVAGEPVPSYEQVWQGTAPANTPPVGVRGNQNIAGQSQYANLLILQQVLEDHYGEPLNTLLQREVFGPLGMAHSFYATELDPDRSAATARGHFEDGTPVPGGYRRYPELAAAGLWTTPTDYAKLVRYVMDAAKGRDNRLLSREMAQAGITPARGFRSLLFHVNKYGNLYWGGNCKGFYANMQAWLEEDCIAVAMANRDLCWPLVNGTVWQSYAYLARAAR